MANSCVRLILVLMALVWAPHSLQAAEKGKLNAAQKDERRENEAVRKAQQDVKAAQDAETIAERSVRKAYDDIKSAERSLTQAASQLQKVREDLESTHGTSTGLVAARKSLDAAQQQYEVAGQPVLNRLRESQQYKDAVKAAKDAEQSIARLRGKDEEATAAQRKQLVEAALIKQVPGQLERAALDAESSLEPERNRLAKALEAVAVARKATDSAIDKDPALKIVTDKIESIKREIADARKSVAQEERQLNAARQKLAREQQDLQQKIAADRRDDNKPNKNKK